MLDENGNYISTYNTWGAPGSPFDSSPFATPQAGYNIQLNTNPAPQQTNDKNMSLNDDQWKAIGQGTSSFASGLADVIGAKNRMREQQGFADDAQGDIDQFYTDFEGGKFDARTNQDMLNAFSFGRQALDTSPTLSAQATSLDMASQDPRMAAASLSGMNTSATQNMQTLQQQDRANELTTQQGLGQYMAGIQGKNEDFSRGIYADKLGQDQLAYSTAIQNKQSMDEARRAGWGNMASGLLEAGSSAFMGEDGMKIPSYEAGGDIMQQILAAQGEGGIPARQDLPGPESHGENPIDMIAPNGEKVGEATGGEIILNGEQTEEIENAVAGVEQAVEAGGEPPLEALMALYEAVSKTLSQPQFQDEQQAPMSPEQERMMMMLDGGPEQMV